ncbi:sodium/calcium exchanger 3-like [Antedon mediterranea]|uniref:sodium/calcium exchanger 3-like n=1 Tax=Antedon mediterranea TaxID=105859 RepID=UPI003AF55E82
MDMNISTTPAPTNGCPVPPDNGNSSACTGLILPIIPGEEDWNQGFRGFLYMAGLLWSFMGVAIVADIFMVAIEVITSKTKKVKLANPDAPGGIEEIEIRVWNDTVANLTLMALGSSAPEILLSIIEIVGNNFHAGELGPSTIVGSAAFNLLVITAVCIMGIPKGESKRIRTIKVFMVTTSFSIFAYIWLFLVVSVISESKVDLWEAFVTFLCFPILIIIAFVADKDYCGEKKETTEIELGVGEGEKFFTAGHEVDREVVRDFMKEVGKHPDIDESMIAKLVAIECQQHQHHSRGWYRINASRNMMGRTKVDEQDPHALELYNKIKNKELPNLSKDELEYGTDKAVVEFAAVSYSVMENAGRVKVGIVRRGNKKSQVIFKYETLDGTAEAKSDYVPMKGIMVFEPEETEKFLEIEIIDDNEWEPDETFFVKLTLEEKADGVVLGKHPITEVTIINDDEPGTLEFAKTSFLVTENIGKAELPIQRLNGCDGKIEVTWRTKDIEAVNGKDFEGGEGTLVFEHGEREKNILIPIIDDQEYEKDESFQVELFDPTGGAQLGRLKKTVVTIINDDDYKTILDRVVNITHINMDRLKLGNSSYGDQFVDAMNVNGGDVENATFMDYILHFLTFGWKVIFAIIPPPNFLNSGGWITFFVALGFIGLLTAIIGDLASIFGCIAGIKDSVTAITFVALGTSLPDLFASKTAATNERYADAAIGNVTGSNSVNVFLGLGTPWVIASIYWASKGQDFCIEAGSLGVSVVIYTICALICTALVASRRVLEPFGKAELGGPMNMRYLSGAFLIFLWFMYILLSSLQAYEVINL